MVAHWSWQSISVTNVKGAALQVKQFSVVQRRKRKRYYKKGSELLGKSL